MASKHLSEQEILRRLYELTQRLVEINDRASMLTRKAHFREAVESVESDICAMADKISKDNSIDN